MKKKDKKIIPPNFPAIIASQNALFIENRCPCCNTELVVCLGRKKSESFMKILQTDPQTLNRVKTKTPKPAPQPSHFKFQSAQLLQIKAGETQNNLGRNDTLSSHSTLKGKPSVGSLLRERKIANIGPKSGCKFTWAERGKWAIDAD